MAIVFLAHTGVKKIRNRPDAAADYSVFSLDMDNKRLAFTLASRTRCFILKKKEFVVGQETNQKRPNNKVWSCNTNGAKLINNR